MRRRHRRFHAWIWAVLAVALPAVLLIAMAARRTVPAHAPSVRIEAPN
jgi:hypothetical protein